MIPASAPPTSVDLSVIVPVYDEATSLPVLYERLRSVLEALEPSWEWILVDDGSRDESFALASVSGTLVHYAVLVAMVETDTLGPLPASALGFLAGAVTNYLGSRRWVFASDARHAIALPKFLAVAAAGFAGNVAGMALALDWLQLPYLLAQILVTGILFFWHYGANRLWTFARRG